VTLLSAIKCIETVTISSDDEHCLWSLWRTVVWKSNSDIFL